MNCRSLRYGHSIRSHAHNTKNAAPSELPLPQTSTLRSRRRLARLLVAGSFVFVFCWSPHVVFLICTKWSAQETYSKTVASYSLFFGKCFSIFNFFFFCVGQFPLKFRSFEYLIDWCTISNQSHIFLSVFFHLAHRLTITHAGYTHSALNPILHWALNQNSLRQSSLLSRLTSVQRFLQSHFNERNHQPPPSSTNEAALGPFNPRFIKARPQPYNNPPASSHFMY